MGQNAKATDFLKECMADALIQKMQEKPFEKVTVNEIADLAGVNRSTWFRNFKLARFALDVMFSVAFTILAPSALASNPASTAVFHLPRRASRARAR